jgi:hypothetical protein
MFALGATLAGSELSAQENHSTPAEKPSGQEKAGLGTKSFEGLSSVGSWAPLFVEKVKSAQPSIKDQSGAKTFIQSIQSGLRNEILRLNGGDYMYADDNLKENGPGFKLMRTAGTKADWQTIKHVSDELTKIIDDTAKTWGVSHEETTLWNIDFSTMISATATNRLATFDNKNTAGNINFSGEQTNSPTQKNNTTHFWTK